MDNNGTFGVLTTTSCDLCGRKGPTVLNHHHDTPVLATCRQCWPNVFEHQARQDIDAWLSGGDEGAFGR